MESRGGSSLVELLRRENAVLRRKEDGAKHAMRKMRDALMSVNRHIYGAKAADMCAKMAEEVGAAQFMGLGLGDSPLANLTNKEAGEAGKRGGGAGRGKRGARKPFV